MTENAHPTRRDLLGAAGTAVAAALSGCGGLLGPDPVELDGTAVAEVGSREAPTVAEPLPVDVADGHVTASRKRAESALESVPLPLSTGEIPNGVVRERLAREAEYARENLDGASDVPGVRERMDELRHAREHARYVAAAWAFTREAVTAADVRERAATVRADARAFREAWEYVGEDPVRALLVHEAVEAWTGVARRRAALDRRGSSRWGPDSALGVGERAGEVEYARAHLVDATHVGDRFTASLSDPPSVRETLVAARESLGDAIAARRENMPDGEIREPNELVDVDRDLSRTPAGEALKDLHWRTPVDPETTDDLADDILDRARGLAHAEAFLALRDRVRDGEAFTVGNAEELGARRAVADESFESVPRETAEPRLARRLLADRASWFPDVDRELRRYEDADAVDARSLAYETGRYVELAAFARAVPDAVAATLDALGVEG
jgi:hypothetical protein